MGKLRKLIWGLRLLLLLAVPTCAFLEFSLIRVPHSSKEFHPHPTTCVEEGKIGANAQYREVCYQKDISYTLQCSLGNIPYYMAADFTTPLSWVKGKKCHLEGTLKKSKCNLIENHSLRQKIQKLKEKEGAKEEADTEDIVIEGSSEVVKGGEIGREENFGFVTRDSNRLTNFFNVLLVGMFIYDEAFQYQMFSTNFLKAESLSPNMNLLSDGSLSLRLDESSENSFLQEMFNFAGNGEKAVTIYLGKNDTITIGEITAKYSASGYAGIRWISTSDVDNYGQLASITSIGIEDRTKDKVQGTDVDLIAIFTLSASYIGLPEAVINTTLIKMLSKDAACSLNKDTSFLECEPLEKHKKNFGNILGYLLEFTLDGVVLNIALEKLLLSKKSNMVFNIKNQTTGKYAIMGEPIFLRYFMLFDFAKGKIGFADPRTLHESFIDVVTLVHFLVLVFMFGCCFVLCYRPCLRMFAVLSRKIILAAPRGEEGKKLRQYQPVQENPYDELPSKLRSGLEQESGGI